MKSFVSGVGSLSVAAIVLTLNEETRIENCLKRLRPHVDYILVLDGESHDKTVEIAKRHADQVEVKSFSGSFAEERNHAENQIPIGYEWILHVDADEEFHPQFLKNLREIVKNTDSNVDAYKFPRNNYGTKFNWPDHQIRLLRRGRTVWKGELHEVPYNPAKQKPIDHVGNTTSLEHYPIIHLPRRTDEKRSWW